MSYLNNTSIEIDAVLTKRGKELLSKGLGAFNITQFALADDEIDYRLWNPNHSLGSNYYGEAIQSMPLLEANPNDTQIMKHKLVTLPKNITKVPVVTANKTVITFPRGGVFEIITPQTNFFTGNITYGYTAILTDSTVANISAETLATVNVGNTSDYSVQAEFGPQAVSIVGMSFRLTSKPQFKNDANASLIIIGNETGGRVTINITVPLETMAAIENNYNFNIK